MSKLTSRDTCKSKKQFSLTSAKHALRYNRQAYRYYKCNVCYRYHLSSQDFKT